jgi:hypothetical protein
VRILSICDEQLHELGRRKQALSYRIAVQRAQLSYELQRLRHPMQSFDRVRAVGSGLLEHAPIILMALAPVLIMLRRPLVGGIGGAVRLARKVARWWALWKLGSRVLTHVPGITGGRRRRRTVAVRAPGLQPGL